MGYSTTTPTISMTTASQEGNSTKLGSRSTAEIVAWSILLTLIVVIAILGNLLVIICVRTTNRLRSEKSNMFLVNLSVTDIGSACVVMTSSLYAMAADEWHMGSFWCDLVCGANYMFIIVSMLTLCFISLDRYAAVEYALRYHSWVTRRKIGILVAWAWFQGFCFGLAPVLADWVRYDYWEVVCAIVWHEDAANTLTYVIVAFAVCFLLPGVILSIAYCKIIKVAKAHNNVHPHSLAPRPTPGIIRSDMLTSAGLTNDHAGISITALDHNRAGIPSPGVNGRSKDNPPRGNDASQNSTKSDTPQLQCSSPELGAGDRNSWPETSVNSLQASQEAHEPPVPEEVLQEDLTKFENRTFTDNNVYFSEESCTQPNQKCIKAGYPGSVEVKHRKTYFDRFKWKSLSAPVSPLCGHGMDCKTHPQGGRFNKREGEIYARGVNNGGESLVPSGGINHPQNNRPSSSISWHELQYDKIETILWSETVAFPQIAAGAESPTSPAKPDRLDAWNEDQYKVCHGIAENHTGKEVPLPNPLVANTESLQSSPTSVRKETTKPLSRPDSGSQCQFSEIPESPRPPPVPEPTARGHGLAVENNADLKQRNYSASSKAVKSLLIVVLAFFICMTPFSITKLYKVIFPRPDSLPGYVNLVATIFQYCASVINPLIYGIFRRDFQKSFLLIFKKAMVKLRLRDSIDMPTDTFLVSG